MGTRRGTTQLNHGHNVGPINPALYGLLGPLGSAAGISDVVSGDNSVIGLARGHHVLTLQSMLITTTASFVSR